MEINVTDVPALALGCGLLGAGGGGDWRLAEALVERMLEQHGPARLVAAEDLDHDATVMPIGVMGAPSVISEQLITGREAADLKALIERTSSHRIGALVAIEIGGMNGLLPVGWAAATGLPLVDADGMGRAFPQTAKTSMNLAGVPPTPAAVVDHYGNAAVFENADPATLDALARSVVITLGGLAANTAYLMEAHQARTGLIHGTVSLAMELGRSLNAVESDRIAATIERFGGRELGRGKVLEVERQGTGGIVHGAATVEIADDERLIRIEFQNENLLVLDGGEVAAAVPDVIAVFDTRQGVPIACEALRYGQRVSVLQLPCQGLWRSEAALELAGPGAFGYVTPEALR